MLCVALDTSIDAFRLEVSFSAEIGKTTILLGESGAGKSTVLHHIAGLSHPQRGHISLDGVVYFDRGQRLIVPPQARPFAYVFQDYILFPHLNVFENVAFGLRAQHLPRALIARRVGEALEQVHLVGFERRLPSQLSGGQQQRVAIARALALQPQLLLLDEPLAALDVQTRREVRQQLYHLLAEIRLTTVMVTHHYLEALLFGHSILVLDHGHVIQQGHPRTLLQQPRSSYVAELVGTNFFHGRIVHRETSALCTVQLLGQQEQALAIQAAIAEQEQAAPRLAVGEEAFVVVDPRSITLHTVAPDLHTSARNSFRGNITHVLHMGATPDTSASAADGRVRVSILLEPSMYPLTAEITSASATQMELSAGQPIYATFKVTAARAYT